MKSLLLVSKEQTISKSCFQLKRKFLIWTIYWQFIIKFSFKRLNLILFSSNSICYQSHINSIYIWYSKIYLISTLKEVFLIMHHSKYKIVDIKQQLHILHFMLTKILQILCAVAENASSGIIRIPIINFS